MRHIAYIVIAVLMFISCKEEQETAETYSSEVYTSMRGYDLEIVKVRNCEYVLWHKGRGSDMEHYEGCDNPEHKNK